MTSIRLTGPISKGDSKDVKGLLIKGTGVNIVTNFKVISVITNGIRKKGVRKKGIITNKASKKKGNTPIKK